MSELSVVIPRYYNLKSEMDSYKVQVDADNKLIKQIMMNTNSEEETCGEYTAKLTVIDKSYFNEEKLIAKLKLIGNTEAIKSKEYVDMDVLEKQMYNGEINGLELMDCKVPKTEQRLIVKKTTKEK